MTEFREMTLADLPAVMDIERIVHRTPWSENVFNNELTLNNYSSYYVLYEGGQLLAYGGFWNVLDEAHITNIAVNPIFRRRGYGGRMLQYLEEQARQRGARYLTLEVRVSNEVAIKMYEKHGFYSVGVRPGYYTDTKEDALIMWKGEQDGN